MKWNDAHQVQPEPNKMLLFITTSEKLIMHGYFITPQGNPPKDLLGTFIGYRHKRNLALEAIRQHRVQPMGKQ